MKYYERTTKYIRCSVKKNTTVFVELRVQSTFVCTVLYVCGFENNFFLRNSEISTGKCCFVNCLYSVGKNLTQSPNNHIQLVQYLSNICYAGCQKNDRCILIHGSCKMPRSANWNIEFADASFRSNADLPLHEQ